MKKIIETDKAPTKKQNKHIPYEAPAVIYEGKMTTRAGTPISDPGDGHVDPPDLFGTN